MTNEKTIDAIRDLFMLLAEHNAILGRTATHVVLDRQAMPGVVDWMIFSRYRLNFDDGESFACRNVFSGTSTSKELIAVDISGVKNGAYPDNFFSVEMAQLSSIFDALPAVKPEVDVDELLAHTSTMLAAHGPEILRALLGGAIKPAQETKH